MLERAEGIVPVRSLLATLNVLRFSDPIELGKGPENLVIYESQRGERRETKGNEGERRKEGERGKGGKGKGGKGKGNEETRERGNEEKR